MALIGGAMSPRLVLQRYDEAVGGEYQDELRHLAHRVALPGSPAGRPHPQVPHDHGEEGHRHAADSPPRTWMVGSTTLRI